MSFGFKRQKGKSSLASPLCRSEGGSRLRNPGHAQVYFDSVGAYVSPYREPSSDLGRSYFFSFHPGSNQRPLVHGINLSKMARERRPPPVIVWPTGGGR